MEGSCTGTPDVYIHSFIHSWGIIEVGYTHSSVGIVKLVPDDDANPLEGLLCPQPGRHTGVDDDGYAALLLLIQAQTLLYQEKKAKLLKRSRKKELPQLYLV
jgi:hypothetical protein